MSTILRSLLFVPGSRPERFAKAKASAADLICIDLEDAVLPGDKDSARQAVVDFIQQNPDVCVRINPVDTQFGKQDLQALSHAKPAVLMIAKCQSARDVLKAQSILGCADTSVIPLIETLEGGDNAFAIANAAEAVENIMFGGADMAAELRCDFSYEPLLHVRSKLVFAAAKASVGLIDVPYVDIKNQDGLKDETLKVKALGFSAKAAIHPCQIDPIHQAFMPTPEETAYAQAVIDAVDGPDAGVVVVNGRMVDRPIILASQRILALANLA